MTVMSIDRTSAVAPSLPTPAASAPSTLDTQRKLHFGHFAFMGAVVQGIDPAGAWDRYLQIEGSHRNARTVRRTLAWIRDAFAAARRERRSGTAKLVLIDIDKLPPAPIEEVSLEMFIVAAGLEDFSQREQLVAYESRFGNASMRQGSHQ